MRHAGDIAWVSRRPPPIVTMAAHLTDNKKSLSHKGQSQACNSIIQAGKEYISGNISMDGRSQVISAWIAAMESDVRKTKHSVSPQ